MTTSNRRAQLVVPCTQFNASLTALTEQLGFRVDLIFPADAPTVAVVSGHGLSLRLVAVSTPPAALPRLRLQATPPFPTVTVPDLSIEWAEESVTVDVPAGQQSFLIAGDAEANVWAAGRAGMRYRDLIPGRFGGRFIASHIRIETGGPVPDYVHFHHVRFQMIFCKAGWVRVVYEDQGPPFVLEAGDCVLQPPGIRHRVLEASAGLEVIELGCPAVHETHADHAMALPTAELRPRREFGGQRFVRHVAAEAAWLPWQWCGQASARFSARDTGIAAATAGLARAMVVRASGNAPASTPIAAHAGELLFLFVLRGTLQLRSCLLGDHALGAGASATLPAHTDAALSADGDCEFLEVALPARAGCDR